jgi:predicted nucleic acid-binding protein
VSGAVLDTSVAIAWYLPESFASKARNWQRRALDGEVELLVPSLHYWEFGNVLRTYVRRGELEVALASEIYHLHLQAPLQLAEPNREDVLERALEYQASVYDAVYIELALSRNVPLVTAEKSTTPWVVKLGRRVKSVAK